MAVVAPIISTWDNTGVRKATRSFGRLSDAAKTSFGKIGDYAKTAAKLVAGIGVAGAVGAYKAVDAASSLEETMSKVGTIFGDVSDDVIDFSKTAAGALGLSQNDALNAAADFATRSARPPAWSATTWRTSQPT
jgi:hypothetical protein